MIITQEGKPDVRLVAMIKPPQKQRRFGSARGLIKTLKAIALDVPPDVLIG